MLIIGTEGYLPVQKKAARPAGVSGGARPDKASARFDSCSLSPAEDQSHSFREAVSTLSRQVRTATTTGRIQELRSQVRSGEYQISPREVAARMLLIEEGE